jgi:hypothetical protein
MYSKTHPGVLEAHHGVIEPFPVLIDSHRSCQEAHHGVIKPFPVLIDSHRSCQEAHHGVIEPYPVLITRPGVLEAHLGNMKPCLTFA